jgi:hypothetical protein
MLKFKQIREATKNNPYAIGMAVAKKKAGLGAAPAEDLPKNIITKAHEIAKKIKANEEFDDVLDMTEEQLDEISKQLALNYLDKAPRSARIHGMISKDYSAAAERKRNPGLKQALNNLSLKYKKKAWSREDGIKKAINKVAGDQ